MRSNRRFALGATVLALIIVTVSCGGKSGGSETTGAGATVASQLILGGPPECPQRPFCIPGLKQTYGITFKGFKALDVGGPQTVAALKSGAVQVGLLFSTDPVISVNGWVALEDDKHLQQADIITPVVRTKVLDDTITTLLNGISAKLTTDNIVPLIKSVSVDKQDVAPVAKSFLEQQGLLGSPSTAGKGKTITVGVSSAFAENQIVAEMYGQVLENAGYRVNRKFDLGSRAVSDKALESGDIDVKPEYLASELSSSPLFSAADKA